MAFIDGWLDSKSTFEIRHGRTVYIYRNLWSIALECSRSIWTEFKSVIYLPIPSSITDKTYRIKLHIKCKYVYFLSIFCQFWLLPINSLEIFLD